MNFSQMMAEKDFSKKTLRALSRKGVTLYGIQMVPDFSTDLPMANAEKVYLLNDNGTSRVRSFREVLNIAEAA